MSGGDWPDPHRRSDAATEGDPWIARAEWALGGAEKLVKTVLWLAIPLLSLGFLAFVPAAQAWFWTRSKGWLVVALALLLGSAALVVSFALDAENAAVGALLIATPVTGTVSALFARPVAFGQVDRRRAPSGFTMDEQRDPAVRRLLERRHRRKIVRRLIERDLRRGYDSLAEVGALSSLDPALFEHHADRLVVLPWRPR